MSNFTKLGKLWRILGHHYLYYLNSLQWTTISSQERWSVGIWTIFSVVFFAFPLQTCEMSFVHEISDIHLFYSSIHLFNWWNTGYSHCITLDLQLILGDDLNLKVIMHGTENLENAEVLTAISPLVGEGGRRAKHRLNWQQLAVVWCSKVV